MKEVPADKRRPATRRPTALGYVERALARDLGVDLGRGVGLGSRCGFERRS
jgi:hypothetical protein